jgi:alpha-N-arabinofuranosidase
MHTAASPCLISDWNYTPTPYFGALVKRALANESVPIAPRLTTAPDSIIYDDKFESGWQSWSSATIDPAATENVHTGTDALKVTLTPTQQVQFGNVPADGLEFNQLSFWVNGGPTGGQRLYVQASIMDIGYPSVNLDPLSPNTWTHETISLQQLGVAGLEDLKSFRIGTTDTSASTLYLDDVTLVGNH